MICTPYKELYVPKNLMSPNWEKALSWLKSDSWKNIPLGKTEIDGSRVYVNRAAYTTNREAECRYESHRVYADIQLVLKGSELSLSCVREGLKVVEPYSGEKDIDFLEGKPDPVHGVILSFPMAVIFFPWDIHMPKLAPLDKPGEVEKLTLKIAM